MNPNNYGTLPACQRLAEAGIVMETERVWIADEYPPFGASMKVILKWDLVSKRDLIFANFGKLPDGTIPAPSLAEVWRELPESYELLDLIEKFMWEKYGEEWEEPDILDILRNPDRMIDLLIWVRKEK